MSSPINFVYLDANQYWDSIDDGESEIEIETVTMEEATRPDAKCGQSSHGNDSQLLDSSENVISSQVDIHTSSAYVHVERDSASRCVLTFRPGLGSSALLSTPDDGQKCAEIKPRMECPLCRKLYNPKYIKTHQKAVHGVQVTTNREQRKKSKPTHICVQCGKAQLSISLYVDHLKMNHGFRVDSETLGFDSTKEFESWKEEIQLESDTYFNQSCNTVKGNEIVRYYKCIGSQMGPNTTELTFDKVLSSCPASIKEFYNRQTGAHTAVYCSTHLGHGELNLQLRKRIEDVKVDYEERIQQFAVFLLEHNYYAKNYDHKRVNEALERIMHDHDYYRD